MNPGSQDRLGKRCATQRRPSRCGSKCLRLREVGLVPCIKSGKLLLFPAGDKTQALRILTSLGTDLITRCSCNPRVGAFSVCSIREAGWCSGLQEIRPGFACWPCETLGTLLMQSWISLSMSLKWG